MDKSKVPRFLWRTVYVALFNFTGEFHQCLLSPTFLAVESTHLSVLHQLKNFTKFSTIPSMIKSFDAAKLLPN